MWEPTLTPRPCLCFPRTLSLTRFYLKPGTCLPEQFYLWQNHQDHIMALAQGLKNRLNTLAFWLI